MTFLLRILQYKLKVWKMCLPDKEGLVKGIAKGKKYIRTMEMILYLSNIIIADIFCSLHRFICS